MELRRDVFHAIADPTRRAIIDLIACQPVNVKTIAKQFDVSRQAISLHLKILTECNLLNVEERGRERLYIAKLENLNEVYVWVKQYRKIRATRFSSLKSMVEEVDESQSEKVFKKSKKDKKHKKSKKKKNEKSDKRK
ncbi:MAG: helix-turn-helix transcriptional regulator [Saprospiraceae bacterium]|nr:helix-turn-helix transcriptional regulator [Saprospiraceae bacterium]